MPPDIVSFTHLAGTPVHYARSPVAPYGTRGVGPRHQRLTASTHQRLTAALSELWELHPWGQADAIVSAGAMVPESPRRGTGDRHVQGRAYDIDALWWPGELNLVTLQAPHQWQHYLAVECVLRRYFGTVLGYLHNAAHHDHWHVDDGSRVRWAPRSKSRCTSVQGCLGHIWDCDVAIDGVWGPQTRKAWLGVLQRVGLEGLVEDAWDDEVQVERWRTWLVVTARRGFDAAPA